MTALLLQFWPYIVGAFGVIAGVWKVYAMGKASQKAKQAAAETAAVNSAKQVQGQVDALKPDDARKELRTWSKS